MKKKLFFTLIMCSFTTTIKPVAPFAISVGSGILSALSFGIALKIDDELRKAEPALQTASILKPGIGIVQGIVSKGQEIIQETLEPDEFKLITFAGNLVKKIARKIPPVRKLTDKAEQITEAVNTAPQKKKQAEQISYILKMLSIFLLLISSFYLIRYFRSK